MNISQFRFYPIIFVCLLFFSIATVTAHPHSWVSVLTEIEGDNKQITGLTMFWTFDLMTTSYTLDGEDLSESHRQKTLQNLADEMVGNLKENDYFTYFKKQQSRLPFKVPQQARLILEDHQLTLHFFLELEKPLLLPVTDLHLQVYEDSYYVDFLWLQASDLQLSENFMAACDMKIIEPNPTTTQMIYAASLLIDAQPDSQLGPIFSQSVTINCQETRDE
ncbi:DUF1007 family protein [Psychromonas hadalis]|uniref:DUF1007 family protein n=1 Tax=Psychromonas hadalis TaxID=211669 RepID=UPI0003B523EB|nr:DUF1007 family protein [Psychromonas hadalis]